MGMKPAEFYFEYTWAEFLIKMEHFIERENREYRDGWSKVREQAQWLIWVNGSKQSIRDLWRFPWEPKPKAPKEMTQEEVNEIVNRYNNIPTGAQQAPGGS